MQNKHLQVRLIAMQQNINSDTFMKIHHNSTFSINILLIIKLSIFLLLGKNTLNILKQFKIVNIMIMININVLLLQSKNKTIKFLQCNPIHSCNTNLLNKEHAL